MEKRYWLIFLLCGTIQLLIYFSSTLPFSLSALCFLGKTKNRVKRERRWKEEGYEEKKRKRGRQEREKESIGSERVGGKKINVVTLQLPYATIIFFHSGSCGWKETFTRLSSMRNCMLVNVCRSLRCSLAGMSHGRRCARSWIERSNSMNISR